MKIVEASITDHEVITMITQKSKAYWGYSEEQMKEWEQELTISPDYIQKNIVYKLLQEELCIAYYSFLEKTSSTLHLDNLFILPEYIGKGIGHYLLNHAFQKAHQLNAHSIQLISDPNAQGFYYRFGFRVIDQKISSIPNRFLPVMSVKIV